MTKLQTRIQTSLECLSDERLEAIGADGYTFATARWLRLLDLAELTGGEVELKFAVVSADGLPVSVCPLLRARGAGLVVHYNFRRYYFEYWIEENRRLNGAPQEDFERTARFATRFLRLLDRLRCSTDDFIIACSPLSYRTQLPVSQDSPVTRQAVCQELVAALKRYAGQLRRPLACLWVPEEDDELSHALEAGGCQRAFAFYDNYVCLDGYRDFEDYLKSFNAKIRWKHRKEIRTAAESGVHFDFVDNFVPHADAFTRLYQQTYSKHGTSFFHQPPGFWAALGDQLGPDTEALIATQRERTIGFSVLLKSRRRREMWLYRIGREYDNPEESPFYFCLAFYGPIERAIESGCQKLWLGPGGYEAKLHRGAQQAPLYNWYWFRKPKDHWLLSPYLGAFGRAAREKIASRTRQSLRISGPGMR